MIYHKELAAGRWKEFSFFNQMANIGSEVERAISFRNKKDEKNAQLAFERALELIDLTIMDKKNRSRLKEILRVRENFVVYFACGNNYNSTDENWKNYFYSFAVSSAISN